MHTCHIIEVAMISDLQLLENATKQISLPHTLAIFNASKPRLFPLSQSYCYLLKQLECLWIVLPSLCINMQLNEWIDYNFLCSTKSCVSYCASWMHATVGKWALTVYSGQLMANLSKMLLSWWERFLWALLSIFESKLCQQTEITCKIIDTIHIW